MSPSALLSWAQGHQTVLWRTISEHLALSAVALGIVLVVAVPLGIAIAKRPRLASSAIAVVNMLRTVPSLALLVLMLPILGTGFVPSVVALTLYGLPAVLLNTTIGIRDADPEVIDAARGQGLSERQILFRIAVPLALPVILAGVRTSAVQVVSAATLAVFVGGGGLGELISSGLGLMDMAQLLLGAILVALLAALTELAFGILQRLLARRYGFAA